MPCLEMHGRLQLIPIAEQVKNSHVYRIHGDPEPYTYDKKDHESHFRVPHDSSERIARVGGRNGFLVRMFSQVKLNDEDRKKLGF